MNLFIRPHMYMISFNKKNYKAIHKIQDEKFKDDSE